MNERPRWRLLNDGEDLPAGRSARDLGDGRRAWFDDLDDEDAADGDTIPVYLITHARWLLWRTETRIDPKTGEQRTTKVPISFHTGKRCDVTAPASWTDYDKVKAALARAAGAWDGAGFALGLIESIGEVVIGLDLDTCLGPDGDLAEWAQAFLAALRSYAEVSPGGLGIKVIARIRLADLPETRRLLDIAEGDREQARTRVFGERVAGQHAPGAQLFLMARYFTVTGRHWVHSPEDVTLLSLEQIAELAALFGPEERRANGTHREAGAEDDDTAPDEAALRNKLQAAFVRNPRLKERWQGGTQGLNDTTRSGRDMSVLAMLVTAGFTRGETYAALRWFDHGKVKDEPPRYFGEMWRRTKAAPRQDPEPPADWELQHPPPPDGDGPLPSSDAEQTWRETDPNRAPEDDPRPQPPPHGGAPDTEDWPEPVDFMAAQLGAPILKERHVPPPLWSFITDNAERMGVATSSVALCAVVSCSAAISEEWKLQPKRHDWEWLEAARLWGAIVGPPSVLKSPIIALTTKPIEMLDIKAIEEWNAQQIAHAAWKEAGGETVPEPKTPPRDRFLVESATIEALQEVLRDDAGGKLRAPLGKVLVRQDELEEFLANMDKYSTSNKGNDRGAWLRAYNGGRHTIDRIGRGSFATKSWSACLLGGIQPDVIREIAKRTTDNGLIQRFMLDVPGPQSPGLDRAPNLAARDLYRALFPVLAALHPARDPDNGYVEHVTLHTDAHAAREDIEGLARVMAAMPDASSRLASTFGKWTGLFARLALTFHLIEAAASRVRNPNGLHPPLHVVTAETANRVRRYMRAVLAPSLLRAETLMFGTVQTEHAARIANYILAHRLERVTAREIVRAYRTLRPPEERGTLNSTMDALCLFGWLAPVPPRHEGATPTAWRVNPGVHVLFAERAEAERKRLAAVKTEIAQKFAAQGDDEC